MLRPQRLTLAATLLAGAAALHPLSAEANGNHFGWCKGTNNPHRQSSCGVTTPAITGPGTTIDTTGGSVPAANNLPSGQTTQPTPTGVSSNVIEITPNPPETITGTSPVPTVTGTLPPPITGTALPPVTVTPDPPQTFTGFGQVPTATVRPTPSFTGQGLPTIVVQPNPPQVLTGTSPQVPVSTLPTPVFTGGGITVTPTPPRTVTGTSPVPQLVPQPTPTFTGQGLPTIVVLPQPQTTVTGFGPVPATILVTPQRQVVPQPIPQQVPTATPTATPVLVPTLTQPRPGTGGVPSVGTATTVPRGTTQVPGTSAGVHTATSVVVPRPRPTGNVVPVTTTSAPTVTHRPQPRATAVGRTQVTPQIGRQDRLDPPQFADSDGKGNWRCLASGHGVRRTTEGQRVLQNGALRHVGSVDVLGRDLPALHPRHSDCIVSVRRRGD